MSLFSDFMSGFSNLFTGGGWQAPSEQRQQQIQQQVAQATYTPYEPPQQTYTPSYSAPSYTPSYTPSYSGYSGGYSGYGGYTPIAASRPAAPKPAQQQTQLNLPTQIATPTPASSGTKASSSQAEKKTDNKAPGIFEGVLNALGIKTDGEGEQAQGEGEGTRVEDSLKPGVTTEGSTNRKVNDINASGLSAEEQEAISKAQSGDNEGLGGLVRNSGISRGLAPLLGGIDLTPAENAQDTPDILRDAGSMLSNGFIGALDTLLGTGQANADDGNPTGEVSQETKDLREQAANDSNQQQNANTNRGSYNDLMLLDPDNAITWGAMGQGATGAQAAEAQRQGGLDNLKNSDDIISRLLGRGGEGQGQQGGEGDQDNQRQDEVRKVYGQYLDEQLDQMSDMDLINLMLQNNEGFRNYMAGQGYGAGNFDNDESRNSYGDAFTDFLFIEDPYNIGDDKRNRARDLFGLNEGDTTYTLSDDDRYIQSRLMDMLYASGMQRDLQGDDLVNGIVNTYFDPNYLIDIGQWGSSPDSTYQMNNIITYDDVAAALGRYLANQEGGWNQILREGGAPEGLNSNDLAAWIMAGNLYNKGAQNLLGDYTQYDLSKINSILADAGDTAKFTFDDSDPKNGWWNANQNRTYSTRELNNALLGGGGLNPYGDYLIDQDMADNIVSMLANATGKGISRSWE